MKSLSRVRLLATPWTATHQAPLSMGFSRQEYWSGVPLLEVRICPPVSGTESLRHVLVENVQKGKKALCNQVSKEKGPEVNV